MITYQVEKASDVIEDIKPLLELHWKEVAINRTHIKLNPDFDSYLNLSDDSKLFILTARKDGALIGYNIYYVLPNLHYGGALFAEQDVIYVTKPHRFGRVPVKLLKYAEDLLIRDHKVDVILCRMKLSNDFSPLLDKLGYTPVDKTCSKYVGEK